MSTIDTTKPSRELDAEIAVRLFGWRWFNVPSRNRMALWPPATAIRWNFPEHEAVDVTDAVDKPERFADWDRVGSATEESRIGVPPYSTDIAAAWEVVAEVVNRTPGTIQFILSALFPNSGDATAWGAQFSSLFGSDCWSEEADTAPLAICLAALKAIDAKVPQITTCIDDGQVVTLTRYPTPPKVLGADGQEATP